MPKTIKRIIKVALLGLLLQCYFFIGSNMILAGEVEEGTGQVFTNKVIVKIQSKTDKDVVADQKRFKVDESTKLYDSRGNEIKLKDLRVPCEAEIDYEPAIADSPYVHKIKVKKTLPGASSILTEPIPE